jgi:hypothetical protein
VRAATLFFVALLLSAPTASAQDSGDLSAGYRFIRSERINYPAGWYIDWTRHVNDAVSIVGDIGGTYKSESIGIGSLTQSFDAKIHTFMGGVKVRASTMVTDTVVFGQALLGVANSRTESTAGTFTISDSSTDAALNLSGGVDVWGDLRVGLRTQIGWLRFFGEGTSVNAVHFSLGARFRF